MSPAYHGSLPILTVFCKTATSQEASSIQFFSLFNRSTKHIGARTATRFPMLHDHPNASHCSFSSITQCTQIARLADLLMSGSTICNYISASTKPEGQAEQPIEYCRRPQSPSYVTRSAERHSCSLFWNTSFVRFIIIIISCDAHSSTSIVI
jgi:hypothetical protein